MSHARLVASMGLFVGVMLSGCGDTSRKNTDGAKSTDPNHVVLQVAGMT